MKLNLNWVSDGEVGGRARVMAAFSYLGVLCFVPLLFGRGDRFVNFHARQGLVLWIWGVLALFALTVPGLSWFFRFSASLITTLSIIGLVSVMLCKSWRFPFICDLSEKL